jgi:hypothetical protein
MTLAQLVILSEEDREMQREAEHAAAQRGPR